MFTVFLVVDLIACDFNRTSFLVGTALSMFRGRLHFDRGKVATIRGICDLLLFHLLLGIGLLLLFQEVALSPVNLLRVIDLGLLNRLTLLRGNLLGLLFRLDGLSVPNLFVLLLRVAVELTGTLIAGLPHFLSHDLTESTVAATISKGSLRCLQGLLLCFVSKRIHGWFLKLVS